MYFQHSAPIWRDFPALVPVLLYADGITGDAPVGPAADRFAAIAKSRLAAVAAESELPEIQAWRRAFTQMGLKPTQYRCASESLLRRFRKEGACPGCTPWSTCATRSRWPLPSRWPPRRSASCSAARHRARWSGPASRWSPRAWRWAC